MTSLFYPFATPRVQVPQNYIQSNSSVTVANPVTVVYSSAQSAGNLNVVVVGWNDTTSTVSTVADTKGNTYHPAVAVAQETTVLSQAIYYASNIASAAASANTVTVTFNTTPSFPDVRIAEYSGVTTFDVGTSGTGNSAAPSAGPVTTTAAREIIVGAGMTQGILAAGSGFNSRIVTGDGDLLEDEIVTSTGNYTATATQTSGVWVFQIATFK
jgi:hypothetical protein